MKIIDGLKLKGKPAEIPDCSRDDLPQFFTEMGFKTGVEIGVAKGEFTEKLLRAGLSVYGVDPWSWYSDYNHTAGQKHFDSVYNLAKKRLEAYPDCKLLKKTSMEALDDFADESIDFVYIDGNHQLKYVTEDLTEWSKKVKPGGVLAGHDYVFFRTRSCGGICHVIPALNAFTQSYNIKKWYLLGSKHPKEGEKRDRWRSWMIVKDYEEPSKK